MVKKITAYKDTFGRLWESESQANYEQTLREMKEHIKNMKYDDNEAQVFFTIVAQAPELVRNYIKAMVDNSSRPDEL